MFWDLGHLHASSAVIADADGRVFRCSEIAARVEQASYQLNLLGKRKFGFLFAENSLDFLVCYLACLNAGHVPLLLPSDMAPELTRTLQEHYEPDWILGARTDGAAVAGTSWFIAKAGKVLTRSLSPELALLLSTSGSTGSPKLVRLSYVNLQSNARSIAQYLELSFDDTALTVLPPNYSYGLSVINSHLLAGAGLVLRDVSVLSPDFAEVIRANRVTSLSGVPSIYQMLWRTGFQNQEFPSLRTLTQAGGQLDEKIATSFEKLAQVRGWRFYVMYGQTEATARISYVPPSHLASKIGSIGIPIPDGKMHIDPCNSELVYSGPNVMLGYATCQNDLALGDELLGVLRTGDAARQDEDGFFYITGRLKRFVKLSGNRIGLDEVERQLERELSVPCMAAGRDERMVIWIEGAADTLINQTKQWLFARFGIHHSLFRIRLVETLPMLGSGKKDYSALLADA